MALIANFFCGIISLHIYWLELGVKIHWSVPSRKNFMILFWRQTRNAWRCADLAQASEKYTATRYFLVDL